MTQGRSTARFLAVLVSVLSWMAPGLPLLAQAPSPPSQPSQPPGPPPAQQPGTQVPLYDPSSGGGPDAAAEGDAGAADAEVPAEAPGIERWLFNAEERNRRALNAAEQGDTAGALRHLDSVLRLRPDDPTALFNAGTARLQDERPATELLDAAAEAARARGLDDIRSRAAYNLGSARMEQGDLPGAIDALKESLRADPDFADAKHNLEVALRRLEQQQQQQQNQDQQQQDQQNQDEQEQDQEQQEQQQQGQQEQQEQDREEQDQEQNGQEQDEQEQEEQEGEQKEAGGAGQPEEQEGPLPQFQDLEDMTAEEAAAILEAIENMERAERREQALEAARKARLSGKKDW